MSAPPVRLHLFFATENDRAVILRQGPTRQYRMILWHRDTDTFEDGQWIRQRIYTDRCDLSPDGRHFLCFTLNGDWSGESEGACSVLSRPPWFTALALFPEGSTRGGCLYRRKGGEMHLIRDFVDMAFAPMRAPCDWRGGDAG